MKPEEHDKPGTDGESQVADRLPVKVLKLYQRAGIKDFSEDELVVKYTPLVLKMVHRIAPLTRAVVDFEDLKSVAYFALVQASRLFDPEVGVAFEVYCRPRIRGAIVDELRKNSTVTRSVYSKWKKLERAIQEQEEKLQRPPTEDEITAALGISTDEYRGLLDDLKLISYVSLDEISAQDNDSDECAPFQLEDIHQTDPAGQASSQDLQELIRNRLLQMTQQQRKVLSLYYYEGLRFKDIAALLKLSESRICQIHTEAILALRAFLDRKESLVNNH